LKQSFKIAGVEVEEKLMKIGFDGFKFNYFAPTGGLDELLDGMTSEQFENADEKMPYFGVVWPSAEKLLVKMLSLREQFEDKRILDLGCGVGVCGILAAKFGAKVTFFDWEERAIEIVKKTLDLNELDSKNHQFVSGDWRQDFEIGDFDIIFGVDVLYEARNLDPVLNFASKYLKSNGQLWVIDPQRYHSRQLKNRLFVHNLSLLDEEVIFYDDKLTVLLYKIAGKLD